MKKLTLIFGCAMAIFGMSLPGVAAQDYCCPQYDPCCCDFDFDGFYVGGNVGVATLTAHRNDLDGFLTNNAGGSLNDTNVTAGVQLGYDWICCNRLLGLVADWSWVNIDRRLAETKSEFDWFTTIRARAGVSVCDTLFYLTAGAAVAKFETRWQNATDEFCHSHTRWGWTGGVGTEFPFWCNFSLGAEVLFLHVDSKTKTFTAADGTNFRFSLGNSAWVGRIVLNYRFGDLCCCW